MAGGLLFLLDDIATALDDVAVLTKIAIQKTAGVLGDDLALNAQQVHGVDATRELPVVWAVAKGSLINKSILVPLAILLSWMANWAIGPLLVIGGLYLCFEGCEKLAHRYLHSHQEEEEHEAELAAALSDPKVDLVAFEKEKIQGAIRTDFVLSAEIIVITLGAVQKSPLMTMLMVLIGVSIVMTVGVYGIVAGIVKLDDLGLYLSKRTGEKSRDRWTRALGGRLMTVTPYLMKGLAIVGTIAMFLVGGGIVAHGIPPLHHALEEVVEPLASIPMGGVFAESIAMMFLQTATGILAGFAVLLVVHFGKRCFRTS